MRTGWTQDNAAGCMESSIPPSHSLIPGTQNVLTFLNHQLDPCQQTPSLRCQLLTCLSAIPKASRACPPLTTALSSGSRMGSAPRQ